MRPTKSFCGVLPTACKIGDIDGQHRKQAGRYEGDDSLQESYCILHEPLHPFPNTPDNSQPIKPIWAIVMNGLEVSGQAPVEHPTK